MELSSTLGVASSSSAPSKHNVFLSFRGEDTRHAFTGNLYHDLVRKDLNVYRDDLNLQIEKMIIRPELLRAIEVSKLAIVILSENFLSENYAESTWCLDELAKIVECVKTRELILFPVFYRVDPSDVRRKRNTFDLAKYEADSRIAKDRVDSWRRALSIVGHTAGHHVTGDRYETHDRDEIVQKISQQLLEARWKHDVFLSFRGEDTRYGFTGNLYIDLVRKDLNVYMDDKKLQGGKFIRPELLRTIEESMLAIVILSENYAESTWCLDELAKIVECVETRELILFPVFYTVDPSDVRRQRNKFDLAKHETDSGIAKDKVDSWRRALHKVGNISGVHVKGTDRYEIDVRDEIVFKISQRLDLLPDGLHEKVRNLGPLIQLLTCLEEDIRSKLVALERQQSGRKRKRKKAVVGHWLEKVDAAKTEFESLQQEVRDENFHSFSHGQLRKRVKRLTVQVPSLIEGSNFPNGTTDTYEARGVPFSTRDVVIGETFRKNCEEVLGHLKNDQVLSIGIYGMGGVGKTTVMKHVHNQILAHPVTFGHVCWVTVSQNFRIWKLQKDIFRELNHAFPSEDDEMSRARFLNDILEKDKYILILDDVWEDIPLGKVGIPDVCKVIVTTRSLDVCNKMVCQQKIKISPLFQKEAWELFKKKLGSHEKLTLEVRETAKHVAWRCGGLLLAIITMAASMREATDIHEWRNALEELKNPEISTINGMKEKVLKVLECSYQHLGNDELKLCFLSCARWYPEDFEIPRDELIEYYIVKGLIGYKGSRRVLIDKGHTILKKLVNCCLLECSLFHDEEVRIKMHNLIRVMALQIKSRKQQVMEKAGLQLTKYRGRRSGRKIQRRFP